LQSNELSGTRKEKPTQERKLFHRSEKALAVKILILICSTPRKWLKLHHRAIHVIWNIKRQKDYEEIKSMNFLFIVISTASAFAWGSIGGTRKTTLTRENTGDDYLTT
jgi:hypothetical protein